MKQLFFILILLSIMSCKAQQIIPLNTSAFRTPSNSYFKDLNNEFDQYVGPWTSLYQGKNIELVIYKPTKQD